MNSEEIGKVLEAGGYLKSVAGDEAFTQAIETIHKAQELGRGILVNGECGVGKTLFCQIAAEILAKGGKVRIFELANPLSANSLADNGIRMTALGGFVMLDDLGAENIVNEYGTRHDYVGEFICAYHSKWEDVAWSPKLVASTNLRIKELPGRYDARVVSRLLERTVAWTMPGKPKREIVTVGVVR